MRTSSINPTRRLARRSGVAGLALLALLGTGLAGAASANATDDGAEDAVFAVLDPTLAVLDPILNPLLGSEESGDDTGANLECDAATGTCRSVPDEGDATAITTTPTGEASHGKAQSHPRRRR